MPPGEFFNCEPTTHLSRCHSRWAEKIARPSKTKADGTVSRACRAFSPCHREKKCAFFYCLDVVMHPTVHGQQLPCR